MAEKQTNDVRREEKTITTGSIIQNHIKVQATKKIARDVPSTGGRKTKQNIQAWKSQTDERTNNIFF